MPRIKKEYNAFTEKYYESVTKRICSAVKEKKISQEKIVEMCKEKLNFEIAQSTISRILAYNPSDESRLNISLIHVVAICESLELDLAQILRVAPDDIDISSIITDKKVGVGNSRVSSFIFDPSDDAYAGYLGKYYCYFFPTISTEENLLTATLEFYPNVITNEERVCDAKFILDTKSLDENKQPVIKEYNGRLIISKPQTSCYCILSNPKIGEISMLAFHHRYFFSQKLQSRLVNVLTVSAGDNRRPTVHRMIISRSELNDDIKNLIKAELLMNNSDIIINEDNFEEVKKELPPEIVKIFESGEIQKTNYYCFPEARIDAVNIPREARLKAILNLRNKSIADKNNKIGHKADEAVFYYLSNIEN